MKTIAALCLINSAFALRFYDNGDFRLTQREVETQLNPFLYGKKEHKAGEPGEFTKYLDRMAKGEDVGATDLDFLAKKQVVIQPDNVQATNQQKLEAMSMEQAQNSIHHTDPRDVHTAAEMEPKAPPLKNDWKSKEFVGKFAQYIDDKDLEDDLKISTADLHRADINLQLKEETLPFYPDVGIRSFSDVHSDHMWYPGDRRHYTDIEEKFDFVQKSAPG